MRAFAGKYIEEYKKNLKIAIPVALSQLGHMAVGVADSVMAGRLGKDSLAAVTVAFSINIPFLMLGIGISYGVSPLIAKADGENNPAQISTLFKHSIILNLLTGILLSVSLFFAAPLLIYLSVPKDVVELAIPFFRILSISLFPLMIFQTFRQFAEGLAVTRPAMVISILGNALNLFLNYVFIFGKFGSPSMGVDGAGYATLSARIFMAFAMGGFVLYYARFVIYRGLFNNVKLRIKEFFRLLKMSLPVGLQMTLEAGAFGYAAIMVGEFGAGAIAAHHVALNMAAIAYMAATGIASAATVRVGNEFGKRDYKMIRHAGFSAFNIVLIFMSLSALQFVVFRESLPSLYINDKSVEIIATSLLLIAAFFQIADGLQVVALGALRGIGDVRVPTFIALVSYWLVGLPIGYIMAFQAGFGVEGVWYGLFAGLTVAALLLGLRFQYKSRKLLKQL